MSQTAEQLDPDFFYRTDDMAMVTYLKLQGHQVQKVAWIGETCYWTFDRSDLLEGAVDSFLAGDATVEPKEYNRTFRKTKGEFYEASPNGGPLPFKARR